MPEMIRMITQTEIAEKLNIPRCYASAALKGLKPTTKIGKEYAYNAAQAWKKMMIWYQWEYEDAEFKANAKLKRIEDIRCTASMLYGMALNEEESVGDTDGSD